MVAYACHPNIQEWRQEDQTSKLILNYISEFHSDSNKQTNVSLQGIKGPQVPHSLELRTLVKQWAGGWVDVWACLAHSICACICL